MQSSTRFTTDFDNRLQSRQELKRKLYWGPVPLITIVQETETHTNLDANFPQP